MTVRAYFVVLLPDLLFVIVPAHSTTLPAETELAFLNDQCIKIDGLIYHAMGRVSGCGNRFPIGEHVPVRACSSTTIPIFRLTNKLMNTLGRGTLLS